jgi:hypothetical protein
MREGTNSRKTIWNKSVVLLGIPLRNTLKTCGSTMGTWSEHKKEKKNAQQASPQRKKEEPF